MTLDSIRAGHFTVCSGVEKYLKFRSVGCEESAEIFNDLQLHVFLGVGPNFYFGQRQKQ